jgi:hypothetical protein
MPGIMTIGHAIAIAALDHDMSVPPRILLPHSINYAAIPRRPSRSIQEIGHNDEQVRLNVNIADYERVTRALEKLPRPESFTAKELQVATADTDGQRRVPMTQLNMVLRFWCKTEVIGRTGGRNYAVTSQTLEAGIRHTAELAREACAR